MSDSVDSVADAVAEAEPEPDAVAEAEPGAVSVPSTREVVHNVQEMLSFTDTSGSVNELENRVRVLEQQMEIISKEAEMRSVEAEIIEKNRAKNLAKYRAAKRQPLPR